MGNIVYQVCDTSNACVTASVSITINNVNQPPVAVDDLLTIDENTTNNFIDVQANDSDPDGAADILTTSIITQATNGVATVLGNGGLSYTPTADYFGMDNIVYQVCDTSNACVTASVSITINNVNQLPVAVNDLLTIDENTTNNFIDVQANDSDPDGTADILTTTIVTQVKNGVATVLNNDSLAYTLSLIHI